MNLADIMDEAAEVLEEISGLRVHNHPPGSITPPAGVVSYPESITYDATYGRGADQISGFEIMLLANKIGERSAREAVSRWAAGSGVSSVKARMEAHEWQSCDDFRITEVNFLVVTIGGSDYLAAQFLADITGSGE